ncbi:MAG: hypothetical protein AMXMBFR53_01800 [Gemmatimonadota bacterium]
MRSATSYLLLLVAALSAPAGAGAQAATREPPTLVSDRPGLGDAAHVLGPGVWQGEAGVTIDAQVNDEFLTGSVLVRRGFRDLEVRLLVPTLVVKEGSDLLQLGDLGVGVKVPLELGGGWRWAGTGRFTLPTGSEGISAEDPGVGASLIGERSVTERLGFAFNAGYGGTFGDFGAGTLSLIATPTLAWPGREGLSVYAGYAGFVREGEDDHFLELGFAQAKGADRQWDLNSGYNFGRNTWFLGIGMSVRRR